MPRRSASTASGATSTTRTGTGSCPPPTSSPPPSPAGLHPGRRLHRDVGLLPRPRLQLFLPLVLRLPAGQGAARRLLGAGGQARQGRLAVPGGLRADHLCRGYGRGGGATLRRALPLLLQPLPEIGRAHV